MAYVISFRVRRASLTSSGAYRIVRTMKPVTRVILVIVSTIAYLGLAVWGWGSITAFLLHPARVALAAALVALSVVALFAGGNLSAGAREDRANRWVLAPFALIGLLDGYLPSYTDRIGFWTVDGDTVRWLGVILFVVGGMLRIGPVFVLGSRFSGLVAIQPGHTLVTGGMYRWIRHPSYLGLLLIMLGWGLAFRAGVGIVLTVLIVPPLIARIRSEERLLASHFGDEYAAYRARTARLIPGIY